MKEITMTTVDAAKKNVSSSPATNYRLKRFSHFVALVNSFPALARPLRILDIGGTPDYWNDKRSLITRSNEITLLNFDAIPAPGFESVGGDACSMPEFADNQFDIVHSNSVIEHVGMWRDMMRMANEIRRIAPAYFVQTPYYWFPIEPHARTPFLHWLPSSLQLRLVMNRKLGPFWSKAETVDKGMRTIQAAYLLDKKMFGALFPDARIVSERVFGFIKSLMAIRAA